MKAMKKIMVAVLLSLSMVVSFMPINVFAEDTVDTWDGSVSNEFAGGIGTAEDPYQISKGSQLAYLERKVNAGEKYENKYFVLTSNINLNSIAWTPIGNTFSDALFGGQNYSSFDGSLDGKGYTISNIKIGSDSVALEGDSLGLFGATSGKICNLNLNNVFINGIAKNVNSYVIGGVGSLVGFCNGSLENCHVENISINMDVPGSGYIAAYWIGGLVGVLDENQYIKESSVSGKIIEKSGNGSIGGFIGELGETAKISFSSANVELDVTSNGKGADVGGFIGKGNGESDIETVISNSFATGDVKGGSYSGGFAGNLWGLNIRNCYASGDVEGASNSMASFVGSDAAAGYAYGTIKNCYTTGKVKGSAPYIYSFCQQDGTVRSTISNCYYLDVNENIQTTNESAQKKTLDEMKTKGFIELLNAGDDSNGWIYVENQLPFAGAEPADYTKVNEAKVKVPNGLSVYTDESVEVLQSALNAVIEGKTFKDQNIVNGYATTIENAIAGLKYKPADYTKVNEAKAKVPSDLTVYTDETVKKLQEALDSVEEDKNITEQAIVDGYAKSIEDALDNLERKQYTFKILKGDNGIFEKTVDNSLSIQIDHDYTENVRVEVDGKEVAKTNYKVTKGSTIVTFNKEYLESLAVGNHEVKVYFEDGVATSTITVKEKAIIKETPKEEVKGTVSTESKKETENKAESKKVKTGDDANILSVSALLVGSLVVLIYLRKKEFK